MNPHEISLNDPLRVGIVGPGRVGTALARALHDAGVTVEGPLGRGERPAGCDAILLCVPDAEIAAAAEVVTAAAPFVGHTSGATRCPRWHTRASRPSGSTLSRPSLTRVCASRASAPP